jgi:hypothetical protein
MQKLQSNQCGQWEISMVYNQIKSEPHDHFVVYTWSNQIQLCWPHDLWWLHFDICAIIFANFGRYVFQQCCID